MSSINGEEAASSLDAPTASVAMDTKQIVVATDRGEGGCYGSEEDDAMSMAMLVVTVRSKDHYSPSGSINPLLLVSARVGSWEALNVLLESEDAQIPPMMIPTERFIWLLAKGNSAQRRIAVLAGYCDVEEGVDHNQPAPLAAGGLLKGVTPDGDTALHVVARNGDGKDFLRYARIIYDRDSGLLFAKNHRGDTPLHCAARAGNIEMASHLIHLAGDRKLMLLRMENKRHETALHDAIRIEDGRVLGPKDREALFGLFRPSVERIRAFVDQQEEMTVVKLLMSADPQLGNYPAHRTSPLYLAILLEKSTIALTLYSMSGGNLSYSGPDGQNALHVAVLRDTDTANPGALYQADKDGFFPIHVAASVGAIGIIQAFLQICPDCAGLRDAKERTFLHVAIENQRYGLVSHVCGDPSLYSIMNMQDNDGNTALHIAIQAGSFRMFCALFGNRKVNLNLTNDLGETPLDLSRSKLPRLMGYTGNSENKIHKALLSVRANHGARCDKIDEKYSRRPNPEEEDKESQRLKDATDTFIVASVLIATMAFSATFAIPGGYRADDHINGGTPTLAGGYIFDSFIMATALAFVCSLLATTGFMLAGIPMVNLMTRRYYLATSQMLFSSSVTCMSIVFALGVYMVLAPVARSAAVAVCVITPAILVGKDMGFLLKILNLARPLCIRKGLFLGMVQFLLLCMFQMIALWPFLVIFGWSGLARIHHGL